MRKFKVTAAGYTGTKQITKTVEANNAGHALRMVSPELEAAGWYAVSVVPVN